MNGIVLENRDENLETLTYYLITLFYQTERKYSCPRTKTNKILSILAFRYAINGERLFNAGIYKYDGCGTLIKDTRWMIERDEYSGSPFQDDMKYIEDELKTPANLLPKYSERYNKIQKHLEFFSLPSSVMKETEDVFRNFGAYSGVDLGNLLNPIVDKLTSESYGEIDIAKISSIIDEVDQDNEVIKYLKEVLICKEITNNVEGKRKIKKI